MQSLPQIKWKIVILSQSIKDRGIFFLKENENPQP